MDWFDLTVSFQSDYTVNDGFVPQTIGIYDQFHI